LNRTIIATPVHATPSSLASLKFRMVPVPFWCRVTHVVLEKKAVKRMQQQQQQQQQ